MADRPQRRSTGPLPVCCAPPGAGEHRGVYGDLPLRRYAGEPGQRELIEAVQRAGLRGRGGGGFPTGTKLAAVAEHGRTPVVIANGCESEPASSKDRALLTYAPHLVLDGAVLAAHAVGADRVVVCVERGAGLADRLEREIARRRTDPVRWEVARLPRRYVASESSALVQYLNTGDARPTFAPPRTSERGVGGRPHAGRQRGDAGPPGADRAARPGVVPRGRHRHRSRLHPGHGRRRGAPARRLRDRARHPPRRGAGAGRRRHGR